MRGFRTFHSISELRHLPGRRRNEIVWAAVAGAGWSFHLLVAAAVAAWLVVVSGGMVLLLHAVRGHVAPLALLGIGAAGASAACTALHQLVVRVVRACVRAFLKTQRRDGRLQNCVRCGYDQRGTVGAFCPECGAVVASPWAARRRLHYRRAA